MHHNIHNCCQDSKYFSRNWRVYNFCVQTMYKYTTNTTCVYYHRQYIAQNLHHILHTQSNISLFLVFKMHPVRFQLPTFANTVVRRPLKKRMLIQHRTNTEPKQLPIFDESGFCGQISQTFVNVFVMHML